MNPSYEELVESLRQIAKGEGRFSLDHMTHANNTIEDMKAIAEKILARVNKNVRNVRTKQSGY